ncbi:MAG: hypothetical protein PHQ80_01505 [Candidatus ainarchaeum sp.]|nr:hypothetical protein [Candidatus ainarchaeum sp.]MDD5095890.1 hypothetical protein [Candidatus ainarchaeum sp.]
MASARIERPREENLRWREAVVKIDSDTFMRVQYLFYRDVLDYKTLASLVVGGDDFGRAWVVNARGVTADNAASQDWRAYASGSRAAVRLLEESGVSEIISHDDNIARATTAQKDHFQALSDMTAASLDVARNPNDQDALARLEDAVRRMRQSGRDERRRRERAPASEEAPQPELLAEAPPRTDKGGFPAEAEAALSETELAAKEAPTAANANSCRFFTPDDPRGLSYGFEIHWKDGYVPNGEYDLSDIWSTERFLFTNLDGIDYYNITGYMDGHIDGRVARQFSGESFAVEYMRRAFLRLETDIGGETVRIYVPRELDVSGKTFTDLIYSPDVVAISVMEDGAERFIWDMYAQNQTKMLAALQRQFPDMEFVQA